MQGTVSIANGFPPVHYSMNQSCYMTFGNLQAYDPPTSKWMPLLPFNGTANNIPGLGVMFQNIYCKSATCSIPASTCTMVLLKGKECMKRYDDVTRDYKTQANFQIPVDRHSACT